MNFLFDGSVLRASIEDAGVKDIGIYVCNVSNGVHDKNGRKFQSGKILVKLEGILFKLCIYWPHTFVLHMFCMVYNNVY